MMAARQKSQTVALFVIIVLATALLIVTLEAPTSGNPGGDADAERPGL
jgi:hypothetical protein